MQIRIQELEKFVMDPDLDQTLIRIQIQANTIRIRTQTKKEFSYRKIFKI